MTNDWGDKFFDDLEKREDAQRPVERLVMRPGPGWKQLNGSVWEHGSGVRVHVMGRLVAFKNGEIRSIYQIQGAYDLWLLLLRITGGNSKRAMLALAMNVAA